MQNASYCKKKIIRSSIICGVSINGIKFLPYLPCLIICDLLCAWAGLVLLFTHVKTVVLWMSTLIISLYLTMEWNCCVKTFWPKMLTNFLEKLIHVSLFPYGCFWGILYHAYIADVAFIYSHVKVQVPRYLHKGNWALHAYWG